MCSRRPHWPRHDGSKARARSFKQSCRCPHRRRRRSARRPAASDAEPVQQPALQQPALRQPADGDMRFAAADSSTTANGVVADAARGDGCRARAGRHHGEPGLQAGPHPRSARHAASAACDVGFSQKQAFSAATAFGAANTCQHRPRGQRRRCDQPSRRSIARKPGCGAGAAQQRPRQEAAHNPRPQEARNPRPQEARERQVTDMLARLARSAQPDRNCGNGYFSSWRCRLRTNSVRPVRRSRLSRSALRIDCTSANASSTLWLTTI